MTGAMFVALQEKMSVRVKSLLGTVTAELKALKAKHASFDKYKGHKQLLTHAPVDLEKNIDEIKVTLTKAVGDCKNLQPKDSTLMKDTITRMEGEWLTVEAKVREQSNTLTLKTAALQAESRSNSQTYRWMIRKTADAMCAGKTPAPKFVASELANMIQEMYKGAVDSGALVASETAFPKMQHMETGTDKTLPMLYRTGNPKPEPPEFIGVLDALMVEKAEDLKKKKDAMIANASKPDKIEAFKGSTSVITFMKGLEKMGTDDLKEHADLGARPWLCMAKEHNRRHGPEMCPFAGFPQLVSAVTDAVFVMLHPIEVLLESGFALANIDQFMGNDGESYVTEHCIWFQVRKGDWLFVPTGWSMSVVVVGPPPKKEDDQGSQEPRFGAWVVFPVGHAAVNHAHAQVNTSVKAWLNKQFAERTDSEMWTKASEYMSKVWP